MQPARAARSLSWLRAKAKSHELQTVAIAPVPDCPPSQTDTGQGRNTLARVFLTRLGIPKLWREDPEVLWPFLRCTAAPVVLWLAPSYSYGAERVPKTGGGVLAVNHLSAIDPPLVGAHCPRTVYWMAKAELLAMPVVGEILTWTGAFSVRRGEGDRESLRRARDIAREGRLVGVFVEGTRQRLGYPGRVLPGATMIALQEGVPIVPCGVHSFGWSRKNRQPCAVVWGETMDLSHLPRSGQGYKQAAELIGAEILRLWRQAAEAVAAGFPPKTPDGARRSDSRYLPVGRGSTILSPSTSVKKAVA
jgi:1-acyl-sn-glycerol-3-phosphate acyltransferase